MHLQNAFKNAAKSSLWASILLLPVASSADEVASETAEMEGELAPYVVVATRTPISIGEASPSVAYISAEEMQAHQDHSVVDVLQRMPGVVVNSSGANGSLTSLFLRGTNSDHTGFFLDGRRLNTGFGNQYNLEFISVENLSSAQVQRGASSVNYGSSGIGGVVDLQTRSGLGTESKETSIEVEVGSNDTFRSAVSTSLSQDNWSMTLGGSVFTTDNERENDYYESQNLNTRFDYRLTETLSLELIALLSEAEKGAPNTVSNPSTTDFGETESWLISPGIRYSNGNWSGQFFYSHSELTADTTAFQYGFSPPFNSGLVDARSSVESDEIYLQVDYDGFESALLSSGIVYRNDEALNSNLDSYDFSAPVRPFGGRFEQAGVWSQIQLELTDALELRVGGRYDNYTDFDSSLNGSAEVLYSFEDIGLALFAKLASSYAPPSAGDVAFDADPSGTPLQPEESISYEFGLKQAFLDDSLNFNLVAFRNEIDNLIGYAGSDAYNVNRATTEGIEFNAQYSPTESLDLGLGYTYLIATDDEAGVRLLRRPRHMLQLSAFYDVVDSWSVGLTGTGYFNREDASFGPPPTFTKVQSQQEDFFVVELHLEWEVSDHLTFFGRVENLLDEEYESVQGYTALGRAGYIGARYTF